MKGFLLAVNYYCVYDRKRTSNRSAMSVFLLHLWPHTRQNTPVFDRFESVCESVLRSSDTSCETSIRTFWKFISAFQSRACAPGVDTRKTQQISQENIHIEYCPSEFFTISSQIQVCCSLIHSKESSIASGSRAITPYSKIAQRNFHFPRNMHIEYCPSKFFTVSSQIQICCSLIYSKESSIASGSRAITPYSKIAQRNFHFRRNIHIEYCPSKFFTISSQIQVCCSLIYSKESSKASGSRAITPYSKIAQRNFHFPRNMQIEYCPSKFFTISSQIQVCCSLVCSNEVSIAA